MSTSLGRTETALLYNKSGGALLRGDVVVIDTATANSFTTTTTGAFLDGRVGVLMENIENDAVGIVAFSGYVSQINLSASASIGDFAKTHTVAGQAAPHATPAQGGDFAQVLETGTTPAAILFGYGVITAGAAQVYAPTGITGATEASRYVGATTSGAPVSGTFAVGDFVIAQDGVVWICTAAGTPGTWAQPTIAAPDYVLVRDQKAAGTNGGTFTAGAWQVRDINTEVFDAGGICSIASNRITLAAGTYECRIAAPAYRVGQHRAKLYNFTDSADVAEMYSNTGFTGDASQNVHDMAVITGKFTIAANKELEIQHYGTVTVATSGYGVAANIDSLGEIYTVCEFWKVG